MKHITSGEAQESILDAELWNVNYDGILGEDMSEGTFLVGYTDDIAAVITKETAKTVTCLAKNAHMVEFSRPGPGHA